MQTDKNKPPKIEQICLRIIVNGQPIDLNVSTMDKLSTACERALIATHNTGRPIKDLDMPRKEDGTELSLKKQINSLPISNGELIFFSLKAGIGGDGHKEQQGAIPAEFMEWIGKKTGEYMEREFPKDMNDLKVPRSMEWIRVHEAFQTAATLTYRKLSQTKASPEDQLTIQDYIEVLSDKDRLTREIDMIINGENAAKQASLCDVMVQIKELVALREVWQASQVLGWVKAHRNNLPPVGIKRPVRRLSHNDFTWIIVKDGQVFIDVDPCGLQNEEAVDRFLIGWEWLKETTLPQSSPEPALPALTGEEPTRSPK